MNKAFTFILLLFSKNIFAQDYYPPVPTQFDAFINQPSIEWAAYADDSVRFDKVNFNRLLTRRFSKNKIRVSKSNRTRQQANQIKYLKKEIIDEALYPVLCVLNIYDSVKIGTKEELPKPVKIDTALSTITDLRQILFVQNGILKSYIIWVEPRVIPCITSSGVFLGYGNYFTSCFNFKYNHTLGKQQVSFLSQTKRKISLDSFDTANKLKELYGRNMIETLWPYILKNKIRTFTFNDSVQLNTVGINTSLLGERIAPVDIYDATGNIAETKVIEEPLSPKNFTAIELVQDWYYDYKQNMVFNKIRSAYLYAKKWKTQVQDKESSPILKIIF